MPAKNTIKQYVENGYYHLYNRGVDKREIFLEEQDCVVFLHCLKLYLSNPESLKKSKNLTPSMLYKIAVLNLSKEIDLLAFALMPNHFHLQIKQYTVHAMEKLTRRVFTSYVQYFNKRYKRIGTLFESAYKAVLVENDKQNLYLSSYIHRNPMKIRTSKFDIIQYSSYPYYLGERRADWIKPYEILSYFARQKNNTKNDVLSYQGFVESIKEQPEVFLGELTLEEGDSL